MCVPGMIHLRTGIVDDVFSRTNVVPRNDVDDAFLDGNGIEENALRVGKDMELVLTKTTGDIFTETRSNEERRRVVIDEPGRAMVIGYFGTEDVSTEGPLE